MRRKLTRRKVAEFFAQLPACEVGMEACGGAHYWARKLSALGHTVKLMAAQRVSPYRSGEKNDVNDAAAICEAMSRPKMRFVPIKSEQQQAVFMLHRARKLMVDSRTAQANQIRGLLAEFGIVVPQGHGRLKEQMPRILEDADNGLPALARQVLGQLLEQLKYFNAQLEHYDDQVKDLAKQCEASVRLMDIEGIGPLTATALVAELGNGRSFKNGRQLAAYLGLTPRQHSSAGKSRLGGISKRGNRYLRTLLVQGARAYMRFMARRSDAKSAWALGLKARRHTNVVAVALAAKHARIVWALLSKGTSYRCAPSAA
jgi:transposase